MLKQLSEQDASYLYLETAETPQHVGGLDLVEVPEGYNTGDFFETYKALVQSRMHLIGFMHSKLVQLPLDFDRPFWVQDEHVDIDYHVRREVVPRPGGMRELEELVGRLHSGLLDRSRPLWEFYVIEGLERGQIAIYTKIHHAAMDGASSQLLVRTMYDPTPAIRTFPPATALHGETQADFESIAKGVLAHLVRQEIRAVQFVPDLFKAWTNVLLPNLDTLRWERRPKTPHTPKTLFNVVITNQRLFAARTLPLSVFKQLGKQTGTKVNDVVLAVCSGALREYLLARHALPDEPMTTLVPVSARDAQDRDVANHNSMFLCSLASHLADPYERLLAIHESSTEQKRQLENVRNLLLPDLSFVGGGMLLRHMVELYAQAKLAERLPPLGNLIISNVPGPPIALYIAGLRVLSLYPCSIPFHGSALNITVQSYCDRLDFGLTACRRAVPDLAQLADALARSLMELQAAVAKHAQLPELGSLPLAAAAPAPASAASAAPAVSAVSAAGAAPVPAVSPAVSAVSPAAAEPMPAASAAPAAAAVPPLAAEPAAARPSAGTATPQLPGPEAAAAEPEWVPSQSDIVALRPPPREPRSARSAARVTGHRAAKKKSTQAKRKPKRAQQKAATQPDARHGAAAKNMRGRRAGGRG